MKFTSTTTAAVAALLAGTVTAAKDSRTFAVLRFNGKMLTQGRVDPIVTPGKVSSHAHVVQGGSGFGLSSTGDDLAKSNCSNAMIKGDNSNYWYPKLYFKDPQTGELEDVEIFYTNVYYFFEPTDDEIKAFPKGLSIVSGNAMTRSPPASAVTILDPSQGEIMPVKWTCPRSNFDPPSWPAGSDGTKAGMGDPINKGEGVGFPDMNCDGYASPLRADVHFPSCYNPEAGLTDFANNMAFPTDKNGKQNCPPGWIHVPHLFFEVYWNTPLFKDRWQQGQGTQPFVLANGDVTGYSSHADFMAAWDEPLLQHIIDTCDAGSSGMDKCPGLFYGLNEGECTIPSPVDEVVDGKMSKLPGNNPLSGWSYGSIGGTPPPPGTGSGSGSSSSSSSVAQVSTPTKAPSTSSTTATATTTEPLQTIATSIQAGATTQTSTSEEAAATSISEAAVSSSSSSTSSSSAGLPQPTEPITGIAGNPAKPTECTAKIHTVWSTVTVTAPAAAATDISALNSTNTVEGFKYAGCFKDAADRTLSGKIRPDLGQMTNEKCVSYCKEAGFALAGTEYGSQCYCGNELVGSEKLEESECTSACEGSGSTTCGGGWALSVFSADGEASLKSSKVRRHAHKHLHHQRSFRN